MFNPLKGNLARNSLLYTGSNVLIASIPFLILPLLTRYLTKEDYGIIAMFQVMVTLLIPLIGLSTNGAVTVKYYKLEEKEYSSFITACIIVIAICFLVVLCVIHLFQAKLSEWTSIPVNWLWAPSTFVLCQVLINLALANWQVRTQSLHYGVFLIANTLFNFSLSVLFVVFLHFNWTGRVLGQVLAGLLFAITALFFLQSGGQIRFESLRTHMSAAVAFGLPLVPNYLIGSISIMIGRLLINNMISTAETGVYSVGNQIASILLIMATSFNLAYSPWLYEKLKEGAYEKKIRIVRWTYIYFLVAILAAVGLGVSASYTLPFLVGAGFVNADRYIIWFALGFAFNGMHMMVVNYVFYAEKVVWVTVITVLVFVLNTFLSFYLIKTRGSVGAAQAQALMAFLAFFGVWTVSNWVYPMPWFKKEVFTGWSLPSRNSEIAKVTD
jgi:O-antigen/teichoic acid export membrane protein